MAVLTYLKSLTVSIAPLLFYRHAKFCATHQVSVIVIAIFIVLPLCYPALNAYYLNPTSDVPSFYWELPSSRVPISKASFKQKCDSQASLRVEKIIIKTNGFKDIENPQSNYDTNVLEKSLLLWTHQLQERLANTVVVYPPNKTPLISRQEPEEYTLSNLCFKPNGGSRCLINSPIEFWNYDADLLMNDDSISKTLSKADKLSSFKIPIPLDSVFGNPVYDKVTGRIIGADSIILTYFLEDMGNCAEGQTLAIWDLLLKHVMDANDTCHIGGERIKAFDIDFKEASNHIVFIFNRHKGFSAESILLALEYIIAFLYISLSPGRLNSVKSKFGLTSSIVAQIIASLVVSLSVCSLFGVTLTLGSWKLLPFVLVIIGVENLFILTNAVTSTSMELDVKERVGKGLEKVGVSITKNLFTRLFVLFIISTTIDLVQEFCIFTSVAIIIDYLLQMSFFITTLSIDLRRLEISDLYNRRVGIPLNPKKTLNNHNPKLINGVKIGTNFSNNVSNGSLFIYLMIAISITTFMYQASGDFSSLLPSFKSAFSDSLANKNTVDKISITNTFYETSTATDAEAFWNVVNPKKTNQYFEIRHPRKLTLLWTLDQKNNLTESTKSSEPFPFLLEIAGTKLSVRSIIKNAVLYLKIIIIPAFVIIFAISYLVSFLVPSDQIGKGTASRNDNENKISLPAPSSRNSSFMTTPRVVTLRGRHSADVSLLCANPNGMIITTAKDKHITSWDGRRGVSLKKLERYMRKCDSCKCGITGGMKKCISWPVRAMCMSEKIELAAAGFEDGVVRVWDIDSGQATFILKDTVEDVESVVSSVNVYTAKERVTCLQFVVPTSSSSIPQTPTYEKGCMNFSVKPASTQQAPSMLLATYRNGYFREWDLVSGRIVHTIATNQKGGISYLCVVDDGELDYNQDDLCAFTGARDGSVKCWIRTSYYSENESSTDLNGLRKSRWKSTYTIPGETGNAITCIAAKVVKTENSTYGIVITGTADGGIRVYDYFTGKPINSLSRGTIFSQKEKEQLLLQRKLLIRQQKLNYSKRSFSDAITNIIINLLKQESCYCGNTEYGGFSIVTSSVDEKVHVWQLVRNVMDCSCVALRNNSKNGPAGRLQQKDVAKWDGVISYFPKFIGRVSQPGGSAIVFIKENIVGVRKAKHLSGSKHVPRCHGAEGEWEMWMLEINDPKVIDSAQDDQEKSDDESYVVELSVQTIPLVNEADLLTEEQLKKKKVALQVVKKQRDKESAGELKGFVRRRRNILTNNSNNVVGSNFGPTFPMSSLPSNIHNHNHSHIDHHHEEDIQGQVVDYRQSSQRRRSALHRVYPDERQLSLLDEENETNEFLPFAHVKQVVKIGEDGVAVAYGNFVKVVLFEHSDNYEIVDGDLDI
ncbi:7627_t:CDS:2 [Rhizophagus irregularis]|nr:7627_t:CDS:2 [Rhizophagus irregularis]